MEQLPEDHWESRLKTRMGCPIVRLPRAALFTKPLGRIPGSSEVQFGPSHD